MSNIVVDASWVLPVYRPYMLDYDTELLVFMGGSGSGKSHFIAQKLVIQALTQPNRRFLIIRKVGTSIRDSVWQLIKDILDQLKVPVTRRVNESTFTIEFLNGSTMLFKGMDNSEKIKSITNIHTCWIEEASELTYDDYTQLTLRLRTPGVVTQFLLSYNPISKVNWVYKEFHTNTPDNCKVIKTTYKDNPYLPEAYIAKLMAMKQRNPVYYKIYAEGEFGSLSKLVIPNFTKEILVPPEVKERGWFWTGMDFGYSNDPNPIISGYYLPEEKDLWITNECILQGATNDVIAKRIMDLGLGKERIVADSAEPKSIQEIKRYGISRITPAEKGPDSIRIGIDRINRNDVHVLANCEHTIMEMENYSYKKDKTTNEYLNEPEDMWNHCIDAIRYGIQTVINKSHDKGYDDETLWLY